VHAENLDRLNPRGTIGDRYLRFRRAAADHPPLSRRSHCAGRVARAHSEDVRDDPSRDWRGRKLIGAGRL